MGEIVYDLKWEKTGDMENKEIFLGDFTQKGFYDALHFMRSHGGHK